MAAVLAVAVCAVGRGPLPLHASSESRICPSCQPPVGYQGGPTMGTAQAPGHTTVYALYWALPGTAFDSAYSSVVDAYLRDVATASTSPSPSAGPNVFSVLTEYYETVGAASVHLAYDVTFGGEFDLTDVPSSADATCVPTDGVSSACITDSQLRDELSAVQAAQQFSFDLSHLYVLLLPPGVQVQGADGSYSTTTWCGYHAFSATSAGTGLYAVVPYGSLCDTGQSPNGVPSADDAVGTVGHEVIDAITDPLGTGWADPQGNEISDQCANAFGPSLGSTTVSNPNGGTAYNQVVAGERYYVQEEYSDNARACAQDESVAAAPADKIQIGSAPASVPPGQSTSLTVTVTDQSGNPVPNDGVSFATAVTTASPATCGTITPARGATSSQGTVSVTYKASPDTVYCSVAVTEAKTGATTAIVVTQGSPPAPVPLLRLSGPDRVATSVAVSQSEFPGSGSAGAAVIASDQSFPDALSGDPLAASLHAPLIITDPSSLSPAAEAELQRVVPAGGRVVVVGGPSAVSDAVVARLKSDRFAVQRVAGPNRFATAVSVADALGDPGTVVEASGLTFADALPAGPVATALGGVVLLTDGSSQSAETAAYLSAHPGTRVALGGPAAAADPSATAIVGADRYDTAAKAAAAYFPSATAVGVASGLGFPDALSGGALLATGGYPLLLTDPGQLPPPAAAYLNGVSGGLTRILVFGGTAVVANTAARSALAAG